MARRGKPHFQIEHLIEIAIVQSSVPSDGNCVSAHQVRDGLWIERLGQPLHVVFIVSGSQEKLQEPADRHVRDAEEVVELDAKLMIESAAKVGFQRSLGGGRNAPTGLLTRFRTKPLPGMP